MALRRLTLLTLLALAAGTGSVTAEDAFPAPLPGQAAEPADASPPKAIIAGLPPFAPGGMASSVPSPCANDYALLRQDAEEKGTLIREATARHASAEESCRLISSYSRAEGKIIRFIETNIEKCGIEGSVGDQVRANHKNTEGMRERICAVAMQTQKRLLDPSLRFNDFGDPAYQRLRGGGVGRFH
jgi:hypothetical protein